MDRKYILKLLTIIILAKIVSTEYRSSDNQQKKTQIVVADSVIEYGSNRPPSAPDISLDSNPEEGKKESIPEKGILSKFSTLFSDILSHTLKNTTDNQTSTYKKMSKYLRGSPFLRLAKAFVKTNDTLPDETSASNVSTELQHFNRSEDASLRLDHDRLASFTPSLRLDHDSLATFTPSLRLNHDRLASFTPSLRLDHDSLATFTPSLLLDHDSLATFTPSLRLDHDSLATFTPSLRLDHDSLASFIPSLRLDHDSLATFTPSLSLDHESLASSTHSLRLDHDRSATFTPSLRLDHDSLASTTPSFRLDHDKLASPTPSLRLDHDSLASPTPTSDSSSRQSLLPGLSQLRNTFTFTPDQRYNTALTITSPKHNNNHNTLVAAHSSQRPDHRSTPPYTSPPQHPGGDPSGVVEASRMQQELVKYEGESFHQEAKSRALPSNERTVETSFNVTEDKAKIRLLVFVSKDGVTVKVNGEEVYKVWNHTAAWSPTNILRRHAGVHVLALCSSSGRVLRRALYMTWQLASSALLVEELEALNDGRILVLVGAPDFVQEVTRPAIQKVTDLGSYFFSRLVQYEAYLLVARTGGPVLYEAARTKYSDDVLHTQMNKTSYDGPPMQVDVLIDAIDQDRCANFTGLEGDHRLFCQLYEGYGRFCACNSTIASFMPAEEDHNSSQPIIAVALVGVLRTPQVLNQIRTIRRHPGGQRTPIVMCLDGRHPEPEHLARLLNISVAIYDEEKVKTGTLARINVLIQFSLTKVFEVFQEAEFGIILEDDVWLSPDFMPFFRQTTGLLATDSEMLLCVNAYSVHSYPEAATNHSRLYRHQGTPAYGWMITRAVGKEMEEVDFWPAEYNQQSDWDFYFRYTMMGARHILAPEIGRSRHISSGGVHISGMEQERYYNRRAYNKDKTYVKMDVESARRHQYLSFHYDRLRSSVQLELSRTHPCTPGIMEGYPDNSSFVAFLDIAGEDDETRALEVTMKCLGGNDKGNQENVMLMYLIHPQGRPLYIVGCPSSPFCTHRDGVKSIFKPTPDDIKRAEIIHYKKVPFTYKRIYRTRPDNPLDDFALNNTYEIKNDLYVAH